MLKYLEVRKHPKTRTHCRQNYMNKAYMQTQRAVPFGGSHNPEWPPGSGVLPRDRWRKGRRRFRQKCCTAPHCLEPEMVSLCAYILIFCSQCHVLLQTECVMYLSILIDLSFAAYRASFAYFTL